MTETYGTRQRFRPYHYPRCHREQPEARQCQDSQGQDHRGDWCFGVGQVVVGSGHHRRQVAQGTQRYIPFIYTAISAQIRTSARGRNRELAHRHRHRAAQARIQLALDGGHLHRHLLPAATAVFACWTTFCGLLRRILVQSPLGQLPTLWRIGRNPRA